ncbi:MAG TPA: aminotransferase class IV [Acidimicrobiales bacterium]
MAELDGRPADPAALAALALTGYGHYTSMRVEGDRVRGLALHLDRLGRDCRLLFDADLDTDRVRHLVRHALAGVPQPVVARVTVFDPDLTAARPGAGARPRVLVTTRPAVDLPEPPLRLHAVRHQREAPEVKHVAVFGALRSRRAAQRAGFDDALLVDVGGTVAEAATSNVGFVAGDRLVWPAAPMLPGVTMALLERVHDGPVGREPVTLGDLGRFDAALATNAVAGVRAVACVDDVGWAGDGHPVLAALRAAYAALPPERL